MARKLLALDQSSHLTGYAIFDGEKLLTYGHINQNEQDIGQRLKGLREKVIDLIEQYEINEVAFEDIQLQGNVRNNIVTFKTLAEVFGIIQELCAELNFKYTIVHSQTWKSSLHIGGKTRAEQKKQSQLYVQTMYDIKPTPDEADAICIGAHIIRNANKNFNWE